MDDERPPKKNRLTAVCAALAALTGLGAYLYARPEPRQEVAPASRPELLAVEHLVVTLADAGGGRYLRASLAIELDRAPGPPVSATPGEQSVPQGVDAAPPEPELRAVRVRDRAFAVLGSRRARDLVPAEAKERLRSELADAIAPLFEDASVRAVLFTDFLVQ
jgi:flagellar basal body-associated protein FliL